MSEAPRRRSSPAPGAPGDPGAELRDKKRVLAALVVHDLRSPLSAVQAYLHLIREELGPAATGKLGEYVDDATSLIGKALGLAATILDVDELEDGILRAQLAPVRLAELVERTRADNRPNFEVRDLRVEIAVAPELVVPLDADLFGRVLENLIDNATRYAPRGGRCVVTAARLGERLDTVELAIGNDGPPVPAGERDAIFGRYYQVEARRAFARANRGLGLYFCKLAVEAHGGTIHVEQRGELGAVFVVRLPAPAAPMRA
jgi:two-component system heavy metal sensor histidine kinase CusS